MSVQARGIYWLPAISSGRARWGYGMERGSVVWRRAERAPYASSAANDRPTAITPSAAAYPMRRPGLVGASRANQLPIWIARSRVAGKCPNIGDIGDLIRIAVDNGAGLVAGDRDHLRDKPPGQLRRPIAGVRNDEFGLVDGNEARFGLLLVFLAIPDHALEAVIDLGGQ